MSAQPLVTIQIPCYRQEKEIVRAIESALAQDYPNLEVIVCDDRSPDGTLAAAQSLHDARLQVHLNPINLGRVGNYRRLLYELSRGEWTLNLDGDDWLTDPGFISRAMAQVQAHPGTVFYQANQNRMKAITSTCRHRRIDAHHVLVEGMDFLDHYPKIRRFNHLSTLFNRHLALDLDFYAFDSLNADFTSIMRLCPLGYVMQCDLDVGRWNLNEGSASLGFLKPEQYAANLKAIDGLCESLAQSAEPQQVQRIRQGLYRVQHYFYDQAIVLFSPHRRALAHLFRILKPTRDWMLIAGMYFYKRWIKRSTL